MSFIPSPRDAPPKPRSPTPDSAMVKALRSRKRNRERTRPTYETPKEPAK